MAPSSPSSSTKLASTSESSSQRRISCRQTCRTLTIGFVLGFTLTCFLRLMTRTHQQLKQFDAKNNQETSFLPPHVVVGTIVLDPTTSTTKQDTIPRIAATLPSFTTATTIKDAKDQSKTAKKTTTTTKTTTKGAEVAAIQAATKTTVARTKTKPKILDKQSNTTSATTTTTASDSASAAIVTDKSKSKSNQKKQTENMIPLQSINSTTTTTTPTTTSHTTSTTTSTTTSIAPTTATTQSSSSFASRIIRPEIQEFKRQERVVIATKIHSTNHLSAIEQSLCLFHHAYNHRVLYDIVVFSTEPINVTLLEPVRQLIAPARLIFVVDAPGGLQASVDALEPDRKAHLLHRCNVTSSEQLDWYTYCHELDIGGTFERLAYSWQAEFRAFHIYNHPLLQAYSTMMWLDSDAFCTRPWDRDPIAYMLQQDLVLFFDHFPAGMSKGPDFQEKFIAAFNTTLCSVSLVNGTLVPRLAGRCKSPQIAQVHGFFHITNLDFYRSDAVQKWNKILIGRTKYSRKYDDQIGVTAPAAVLAPHRAWEMGQHGITLDVFHNGYLDGQRLAGAMSFKKWWNLNASSAFPTALAAQCPILNAQ
jgi:hypothetical protein